ncbi:MAG: hypothetical protein GXP49_11150 [Deltaproteobacteria bacterium]|nr:hypothetical protein [Deltaproteobacteria bacterium]
MNSNFKGVEPRELARFLGEVLVQRFPFWSRSPRGWKVVLLSLLHDYSESRSLKCWTANRPKHFLVDAVIGTDKDNTGYPTNLLVAAHCELGKKWENQVEDFLKLVHVRAPLKLFFASTPKSTESGKDGSFESVSSFRRLVTNYSGKADNYLLFLMEQPGENDQPYKIDVYLWPGGSSATEHVFQLNSG